MYKTKKFQVFSLSSYANLWHSNINCIIIKLIFIVRLLLLYNKKLINVYMQNICIHPVYGKNNFVYKVLINYLKPNKVKSLLVDSKN